MIKGTEVLFSTDGGETWASLGSLSNCTVTEEHSDDRDPGVLLADPFSISGTLEIEVRNYQLEDMARWPLRLVEPSPYVAKGKPWLKRKKGRAGHGLLAF